MYSNKHIGLLDSAKKSWVYPVYVPSWKRAGVSPLLNILDEAPRKVQRKVHIMVPKEYAASYEDAYPWATVIVVKKPGLGASRMACLKDADKRGYSRIIMMDDDIRQISLLERIQREGKSDHTRRYSSTVNGMTKVESFVKTLAVSCKLADQAFEELPHASYGGPRNGLFSGDVDTSVGATSNKGSFPSCVMFFDLERYSTRKLPKDFIFHGEDLAMSLEALIDGNDWFTLPIVAYDQDGILETTIPLDPETDQGRQIDLDNASFHYPDVAPYLRASYRNKLGGVKRIGFRWPQWYKDFGTGPVEIPTSALLP